MKATRKKVYYHKGAIVQGSLVYSLYALTRTRAVVIPCDEGDITRTMKIVATHFLRSPVLRSISYRQRAMYCVVPGVAHVQHAVLVERVR